MLFLWLVLLQLVLFGGLVMFLKVIVSKNITKATTQLHELNQDYTQKIEEAKKHSQEADRYYDEMILKAKLDAEKTKVQILKEAHEGQEFILKQTRKHSEDILEQGQKAKDTLLEEMDAKIEERAVRRACEILQQILPGEVSKEAHDHWVNEMFKHGLGALERLNFPESLKEAEVISAHALSAEQKAHLGKKLKDKLGRSLSLNEKIDPSLVAGFKVTLGSVEIDGSLAFKIKETAKHAHFANRS